MKNGIFLSYAGEELKYMVDEINSKLGANFFSHLVEASTRR